MHIGRALTFLLSLALLTTPVHAGRVMQDSGTPRVAPDFELPATDGSIHRLSNYQGRYLLVNFWAVWCIPCRKEMPSMQRAYNRLRGGNFEMLGIHVGPSLTNAKQYAENLGLSFPILVDAEMNMSNWQIKGLPTTFLLDPEGRIIAEAIGERDWDSPELLKQVRAYLTSP